jgi:RHS repeat-associated protein
MEQDGKVYYYHADGLGSIVALTDSKQKVVESYDYDSFGNLKNHDSKPTQPFTYTGREWDGETGLYYYRARYYDPKAGRFTQMDPIGLAGGDVVLFGYVQNNPVNRKDPHGLQYDMNDAYDDLGGNDNTSVQNAAFGSVLQSVADAVGYVTGKIIENLVSGFEPLIQMPLTNLGPNSADASPSAAQSKSKSTSCGQ